MEILKFASVILIAAYIVQSLEFAEKPKDVGEIEGKVATLKCYINNLNDDKNEFVSWWKGNVKISNQAEVIVKDSRLSVNLDKVLDTLVYSYVLLIVNLQQSDAGEYHCEINSNLKSQPAHLVVYQIPSSEYPKCIQSKESYVAGTEIKLSCISELLDPPVQLSWNYKTIEVSYSKTSTEIKESLVYNHFVFEANKLDNDGTFTCFQTTDVLPEKRNCTIQNLNIQYRPEVKIQHASTIFAGSDSILFCQSFANPPVTQFMWTTSPALVANEFIADGQVLTLIKPSIAINGTIITCSAENNVGISRNTITLIISNVRNNKESTEESNDVIQLHKVNINTSNEEDKDSVSLYVVIIIIILVVIIVVVVVVIPVYYQCFCKTRTATDSSGREIYQPTVYYDTRDRVSNSGLYDRSLPRLPSTGHYGHWRHSFASQVPEDLDVQGYTYIEDTNNQNTSVQFDAKPKDVKELEGQVATLKCHFRGFDESVHVVSWWKEDFQLSANNKVISNNQHISVDIEELPYEEAYTYSITISDLLLEDEGNYHCQIDQTPVVSSGVARLTVMQVPSSGYPQCKKSANSFIVDSKVKLTCISQLLRPPVQLTWSRYGKVNILNTQSETDRYLTYTHYTFNAKKIDNDASFTCKQTSEATSGVTNCTIRNLNIQYRPEVKIQHTSTLFIGSDSILFCQSFANPPVTKFMWMFSPVLNANEYITDGQVLTLIKPSITTNGTIITCSAENNVDISRNSITLIISNVRKNEDSTEGSNDVMQLHKVNTNKNNEENKDSVSLYVVIIIIILVVIIVVVVVIIPVYYQCFCKTRTATDSSGREIYQPTVYYDTRDRVSNSGLYDRSLPRLPSTGHYGHWRHSFASQVPEDLDNVRDRLVVQKHSLFYLWNIENQNQDFFQMEILIRTFAICVAVYIVECGHFAARPNDVGEPEGKVATLKCYIEKINPENDEVSWWKGNFKISNQAEVIAKDSRLSVSVEKVGETQIYLYSLLIVNIKQTDAGEYHCEINNEIKSQPAHLAVYQIPSSEYPKCIQSKESYVVGSEIKLSCISEMLNPPVQLKWRDVSLSKTSMEIKDTLVYNHYVFEANKLDNDGTFTCYQTTDVLPEKRNCTIQNLNIQYRPEVKIQHTSTLFIGSDSILFCQSFANPPVTQFMWTFSPVLNANEYIADGQVLTLIKPSITTNGTIITCSAENNVGTSRDTINLIISNGRPNKDSTKESNDVIQLHKVNINTNKEEDKDSVSLYVVIIIIILVVIILVVVVIIPVYYQCFCKTRTATDSSGREMYQPTVYYDTRGRVSNSGLYDRSLPRLPSTGHYGHWRHSFASQVPEDLDVQGYTYIEDKNNQNTLQD
ncbi:uncharacterized protein [Antedon mediterranea]|uniref:uncharacterized protein n=1 Tax=Antedon mediterranea TaxID=105859 RepID=UPI003AF87AD3